MMRFVSRILFIVGIGCLIFGLGSCVQYYRTDLHREPYQTYQNGWDADAFPEPYIALERFFIVMSGGVVALCLGFYLRGKVRQAQLPEL
jgi:hypothetical protein